ncbi:hypothetical protein Pcinc_034442 [Petrolisthes cinctipes]|uniref:Uncharacterized protein n=1 Tax=Petrolisthes cinctipes TaxID=88211 RepID=A0AAE1EQ96_PETCI|nr:hypothetical protein Pcinc_034442 [Petrolisthes cinctipes]
MNHKSDNIEMRTRDRSEMPTPSRTTLYNHTTTTAITLHNYPTTQPHHLPLLALQPHPNHNHHFPHLPHYTTTPPPHLPLIALQPHHDHNHRSTQQPHNLHNCPVPQPPQHLHRHQPSPSQSEPKVGQYFKLLRYQRQDIYRGKRFSFVQIRQTGYVIVAGLTLTHFCLPFSGQDADLYSTLLQSIGNHWALFSFL